MAEMMFALGQTKKKKKEETKVRQTKAELKDVNITDTIEKDIRKEQFQRDQKWKATGRDQIKRNNKFDMARSLFGGTSSVEQDSDEDERVVQKKMGSMNVRDNNNNNDEEDEVEEEVDEDESEDEDEEYEEEVEVSDSDSDSD